MTGTDYCAREGVHRDLDAAWVDTVGELDIATTQSERTLYEAQQPDHPYAHASPTLLELPACGRRRRRACSLRREAGATTPNAKRPQGQRPSVSCARRRAVASAGGSEREPLAWPTPSDFVPTRA
jgi:hypothetical protein